MTPDDVFRLEQYDPLEYLPPEDAAEAIRAAVKAEREACAAVIDAVVAEHLAELREAWEASDVNSRYEMDHTFCEDFGCSSLKELAAAIRARGE